MAKNCLDYLHEIQSRMEHSIPAIDFHIHTQWTDGKQSVQEMYDQACMSGLECIAFTEHARKTSGDWFPKFAEEVHDLPNEPCHAFIGVETRIIDFDGNIEVEDDILSLCDLVIGSVHRFPGKNGDFLSFEEIMQGEAPDIEFRLAESLLDNPHIHILGHPFGMCYTKFGIIPPEHKILQLIEKASRKKVAFEINAQYHPDPWRFIRWCKNAGAFISLGSDAHSSYEIGGIVRLLEKERFR